MYMLLLLVKKRSRMLFLWEQKEVLTIKIVSKVYIYITYHIYSLEYAAESTSIVSQNVAEKKKGLERTGRRSIHKNTKQFLFY